MTSANPGISAMEPLLPESAGLAKPAMALDREANALGGRLHPITRRSMAELLRTTNTYHSNLIEGHGTRPRDIELALEGRLSSAPEKRTLQQEARAHIEVQRAVERRFESREPVAVTSPDFLRFLHREFYELMPDEWRKVRSHDGTRELTVLPGELRQEEVDEGRHVPPAPAAIPRLLERFGEAYDPGRFAEIDAILAVAASHHRLLWIHPFLDGNGRVARLFTDAYLRRVGIGGHGLWTASRGFARHRIRYFDALAAADAERWNDYDGRGARSQVALTAFCRFFLETCLDQVRFMGSLLELDGLLARMRDYAGRRGGGGIGERLAPQAGHLLVEALLLGEFARGDAARITGTSDRTARRILAALVKEKLLLSDTPKGPIRLGLPVHVVGYYFPQLFPEGALN